MYAALAKIAGEIVGGAMQAGKIPKHVTPQNVNISDITKQTIAAQKGNLPEAQGVASSLNLFNFEQIKKITEMASPGIFKTIASGGKAIADMISGKLPDDVVNYIMNSGAAKSLAGGYGPSGFSEYPSMTSYKNLRDLGLRSADQSMRGITALGSYLSGLKDFMPTTNVAAFLPSIQQTIGIAQRNQEINYYNDIYNAKLDASPDPLMASIGAALAGNSSGIGAGTGFAVGQLSSLVSSGGSKGNWWDSGGALGAGGVNKGATGGMGAFGDFFG